MGALRDNVVVRVFLLLVSFPQQHLKDYVHVTIYLLDDGNVQR